MTDKCFWINQPNLLLTDINFNPFCTGDLNFRFNSISRFIIIVSIIIYIIKNDINYLIIGSIFLISLILIYNVCNTETFVSSELNDIEKPIRKSDYFNKNNDINNPLKNIQIPEYDKIPDYSDVDENTNMNKFINNKFFRTESDMIFDKEARQFYTMPNNNLPNKQYEFANWLYGTNDNCKSTSIYAHRLGHSLENKNCDTGLNVSVPTNEGKL